MDIHQLQSAFEKVMGNTSQLYGFHHIGGGDINQNYKVLTEKGPVFLKAHDYRQSPRIYEREKSGLLYLLKSNAVNVIIPIGNCEINQVEYLFMEYIDSVPPNKNFWINFGEQLAKLHLESNKYFGFVEDNYLGLNPQLNHRMSNWGQFFVNNRLIPNVRKAADLMLIDFSTIKKFEQFYQLAEMAFPEESPSLLHGNLSKKNIRIDEEGNPKLTKPAVYYGHREMDLGMTRRYGSFDPQFYDAYNATFPLQADWEIRLDFVHIYCDLVNLNLYGHPYLVEIINRLNKWVD
ncbi:MAG: fructosamine kinase family protein [bacterium]|nr:fructosamine kinase family protein [bacterium]